MAHSRSLTSAPINVMMGDGGWCGGLGIGQGAAGVLVHIAQEPDPSTSM